MIPYIHIPDLPSPPFGPYNVAGREIGPFALHPFGLLVATGVIIGTYLATNRARRLGLDLDKLNSFITWMLLCGFVGGHVLDEIFYHPDEIARRWWSLLMLHEGLSSFGGFTGALIGVVLWKYFEKLPDGPFRRRPKAQSILPFCDVILAVFPVAWIFGRSGCSSVHDHPGALLRSVHDPLHGLLAVDYPARGEFVAPDKFALFHGSAPRFDLGLLELLFTIVLAGLIALTWRKKLPTGTYVAVTSLAYAPVRFAMDYLRVPEGDRDFPGSADLRYAGLTPAQWECLALFLFGLAMAFYVRSLKKRGIEPMNDVLAPPSVDTHDPALAA
ncbi:MAG TPA: prolipoprotein diacylglyceryl transferase family protein [Polyangiaceae bacterium]|jgi:phosphatidylglycerol:prolipoprotein diacylglycerol transferase